MPGPRAASMRKGCCHDPSATLWTPRSIDCRLTTDASLLRAHPASALEPTRFGDRISVCSGATQPGRLFKHCLTHDSLARLSRGRGRAGHSCRRFAGSRSLLSDSTPEPLRCCSGLAPTGGNLTSPGGPETAFARPGAAGFGRFPEESTSESVEANRIGWKVLGTRVHSRRWRVVGDLRRNTGFGDVRRR